VIYFFSIFGFLLSLLILVVLFLPMERTFPAKGNQPFFRPHFLVDLSHFIFQYFFWGSATLFIMSYFESFINFSFLSETRNIFKNQSIVFQTIEIFVLSDLLIYWGHRLQHKYDFLWRFHKIHHTAEHLDWLAAFREHPLDTIYTVGLINLPAMIFDFDLRGVATIVIFRGIWAIYIHSNIRFPIGPLKALIGAPELHHWHHDLDRRAGNYANLSPLMDILFKTYKCPPNEPEQFGVKENLPQNFFAHMVYPFLPKPKNKH
jgi:sterol desaturase/sphingolipid hydroxylase (fatty acid hydroxylase superfamily)